MSALAQVFPSSNHTRTDSDVTVALTPGCVLVAEMVKSVFLAVVGRTHGPVPLPPTGTDPLDLVEVVHGREAGRRLVEDVQRAARHEVRMCDAPPYVGPPVEYNAVESEQLARGVRYRILYDRQAVAVPGRLPDLATSIAAGEHARITDVPMKLVLSDRSVGVVPLRTDPVYLECCLLVHNSVLLEALETLFEMYWDRAVPLLVNDGQAQLPSHEAPSQVERDLLSLLVAGLTEQAIAFREAQERADPEAVVEVLTGWQAVRRRLDQLQRGAREEIRCLDKPPYLDRQATIAADLSLLSSGIPGRTIYDRAALVQPDLLRDIEQQIRAGQQARVLPDLPMKLYLVDHRFAFLPLQREPVSTEAAVVVRPSALLDALSALFEGLWQRALPPPVPAGHSHSEPQQRRAEVDTERLIALLLSGLTDKTIARHLDLGYRTTQRRIAALMGELGAHTRFQAGVQVAFRATRRQHMMVDAPAADDEKPAPGSGGSRG